MGEKEGDGGGRGRGRGVGAWQALADVKARGLMSMHV